MNNKENIKKRERNMTKKNTKTKNTTKVFVFI